MRRPRVRLTVMRMMVAMAVATSCLQAIRLNLAFGIFLSCWATLVLLRTYPSIDRRRDAGTAMTVGQTARVFFASMVVAMTILALPVIAFLAAHGLCDHALHSNESHYQPRLNTSAVFLAGSVAVGISSLLRWSLWRVDRRPRLCAALIIAIGIVGVLVCAEVLRQRREHYLALARSHEVLEGIYGGAEWAIMDPNFPRDAGKAADHGRKRREYEHAASRPWSSASPYSPWPSLTPWTP